MGLPISGISDNRLDVNSRKEVLMSASMMPEITKVALTTGDAYVWMSQDTDINAADTMNSVRNDSSSQDLVIDRIVIVGGTVASRYEIHRISEGNAFAGGTVIAAVNLGASGKIPDASGYTHDTGNTQGTVVLEVGVGVLGTRVIQCDFTLSTKQILAIDQETENAAGATMIFGYFIDRE